MTALSTDDVLRWGHARAAVLRRRGRVIPPFITALEREYHRRRMARAGAKRVPPRPADQ